MTPGKKILKALVGGPQTKAQLISETSLSKEVAGGALLGLLLSRKVEYKNQLFALAVD